jgi:hypothetical protein
MCHSRRKGPFFAILAALSILYAPGAGAQSASSIEQKFRQLSAVEALMVGGVGAGHYAFISQGRPIRIIKN